MASFKIPESPTFNYLDMNNLQGMDSWDTNPNIMRSSDMLNVVKKEGLHQVRHNIKQSYIVGKYGDTIDDNDDILYNIKYVGKIEEYDENGNTVPYYIKISEYLGEYQTINDSRICISVWPTPKVKNIMCDMSEEQGFENYRIEFKTIPFTNYGVSGNRQGLYEHIQFDGKERVFTPIGILSFKCSTEDVTTVENEETVTYKQLHFEIENVNDNPYIPTIIYGSTPDGLDYTRYEALNLLTDKRRAQFLSDGASTTYKLPEKDLISNYCIVKQLQSNGTYTELTSGYTFNSTNGTVTFTTAPSRSPIEGKDNIIVEYAKRPPSVDDNTFTLNTIAGDNLLNTITTITKVVDGLDDTKLNVTITTVFSQGSNFDNTKYEIKTPTYLHVKLNDVFLVSNALTPAEAISLNGGTSITKTSTIQLDKLTETTGGKWSGQLLLNYYNIQSTSTTTTTPGSVAGNTSFGTQQLTCLGFSWIGLQYSAWAEGHVGSNTNGSDSYWNVYERVQLWVSKPSYLNCGAGTLYGVIDGSRIQAGSTGNMYASSTVYPSNALTVSKRINYSSSKRSVSIGAYMRFGTTVYLSGQAVTEMSAGNTTLNLPTITLPKTTTTGSTTKTDASSTGGSDYTEQTDSSNKKYDNVVPGSARLACYYGAKCVTVYGYESDRRVFVSDGTNKDTYSGVTQDGTSSIYYFPDDNYNVLGEDTEILGYAQKHGYLLTFKRGEDSVYVRYGTTQNNVTIFPSSVVTRNLQILSRPIQINDEVLVITRDGIKSITYVSNEIRAELRTYFINNYFELGQDYIYDKMSWFKDDNLLHIFLDKYEFTCDLVTKSYVREGSTASGTSSSSTLDFQYEWYVSEIDWLDNRQAPYVVTYQPKDFERQSETAIYENLRAIGYAPEGIYEFTYTDYKVDVLMKINDDEELETYYKPIKAHYITPFLNMGAINVAKTIKYVYINTRSRNGDMFAVGYIDENGVTETMQKEYLTINDYTTKFKNSMIPFPKLIQIKSKIRKFMNVKLYIQNKAELENTSFIQETDVANYGNMTFDRILVQYQVAGKYRGE